MTANENPFTPLDKPANDGPATFQIDLLPARAAYLIRKGSKSGFRRAVQEASSRWGGISEPIIQVSKNGSIDPWSRQILEISKADALVNIDLESEVSEKVSLNVGMDCVPLNLIDNPTSPTFATSNPASLPRDFGRQIVLPSVNAPLWQITSAGDLTASIEVELRKLNVPLYREGFPDRIAQSAITNHSLIASTLSSFGENWAQGHTGAQPAVIWVTKSDNLADCSYFWNLRAIAPHRFNPAIMLIVPHDDVVHWTEFPGQLNAILNRADEFSPDVLINSISIKEKGDLHDFAHLLGLELSDEPYRTGFKWPQTPRPTPHTYLINQEIRGTLIFKRRYGQTKFVDSYVQNGAAKLRFDSPIQFTGPGSTKILIRSSLLQNLPKEPWIASQIHFAGMWEEDAIMMRYQAGSNYELDLKIPSLAKSVELTLQNTTANYSISDKGKIGNALLNNHYLETLLRPGVYETIKSLTTPRDKELLKELTKAEESGSSRGELIRIARLWGGRSERRSLETSALPKLKDSIPAEDLCAAGWAERGFKILCDNCGRPSFLPIATVVNVPSCPGCGSHQTFSFNAHGVHVHYRLNTFVDQASDQGLIPHVLAVAAIFARNVNTYLIPGLDVTFRNGTKCEIDLYGIHEGRIVVGEVKTSPSDFTEDQILKYLTNAKLLGASTFIFASIFDLSRKQVKAIKKLAKSRHIEIIFLMQKEMQPKEIS